MRGDSVEKRQAASGSTWCGGREIAPLATGAQLRDSGSYSLKTLSNSTNVKKNINNNAASLLFNSFCTGRPRIYLQVSSFMITILNSVLLSVLCTYLLWVLCKFNSLKKILLDLHLRVHRYVYFTFYTIIKVQIVLRLHKELSFLIIKYIIKFIFIVREIFY